MKVFIKAHAIIKDLITDYPDKGFLTVHLLEQARLANLFKELNLSVEQVPLVIINGIIFYTDPVLNTGDLIELFPLYNRRLKSNELRA